jgi:hypothetical protein
MTPKIFLSKMKNSGQKVLSGLVTYLRIQKSHSQISIKLDFKPNLGMGFFFGTEEVRNFKKKIERTSRSRAHYWLTIKVHCLNVTKEKM